MPGTVARLAAAALAAAFIASGALAQELNAALGESVVMIPKKAFMFTLELETTVYRPPGEGPFPVAIINHGKQPGDPRHQRRFRPGPGARFFVERGYLVLVPMRQGFSKSTGNYIGAGCNVESNGRAQAEDVQAVLDYAATLPYADRQRVVVVGQSHGGWTTLAFGTLNDPAVKGLVNFAGGLKQTDCVAWQDTLARSARAYGAETRAPSLWLYGDNDSFFDQRTYRAMHEAYSSGGAKAELFEFGTFATDAHTLFHDPAGRAIWAPRLTKFLDSIGLPSKRLTP